MARISIPFRAWASTSNGAVPVEFTYYEEGSDTEITLGPADVVQVEGCHFWSTVGVTQLFFSDDGTDDMEGRRVATAPGTFQTVLPRPAIGPVGTSLYLGSSGVNSVRGIVMGTIVRG